MRRSSAMTLAMVLTLVVGTSAGATDRPISAKKLLLKHDASNGTWTFVSKDGGFLFPTIGGPDDPQTAGALIEIIATPGGRTLFGIPPGTGRPGWSAKVGRAPRITFDNPVAPTGDSVIRSALFREGKQIKIVSKSIAGVTFAPATTAMAVRITIGSLRTCVRFEGASIRRTDTSIFIGQNAPASSLPDCSDGSLGIGPPCNTGSAPTCGGSCFGDGVCTPTSLGYCTCVSPSAPCGETAPTCNGTCPSGESCTDVGTGCGCLPDGATPCGTPGLPTCGGECPTGQVCRPIYSSLVGVTTFGCGCGNPTSCDAGGVDCGNGFACGANPSGGPSCVPIFCEHSCGQACGDGGQCSRVRVGTSDFCICAVPEPCCDGGLVCPPLQTCVQGSSCGGCQSLF